MENVILQPSFATGAYMGKLGLDLPDTENELFALQGFLLVDVEKGIETLGDEVQLRAMLQLMAENIPLELKTLEKAHLVKNWELVEKLAHKMKGGAVYCGTVKMHYACQYLERYHKAGYSLLLEGLYQQLVAVANETKIYIEGWLKEQDDPSLA